MQVTPFSESLGEFFRKFFDSSAFLPHSHSFVERNDLIYLHAISDAVIAIAYISIPLTIFSVIRHHREMKYYWVYFAFAFFTLSYSATHILQVITLWNPIYRAEGIAQLITAVSAVASAVGIWYVRPLLLKLRSPAHTDQISRQLVDINNRHRLILESSNVGIYEWLNIQSKDHRKRKKVIWSPKMYDMLQLDPSNTTPSWRTFRSRVYPEDRTRVWKVFRNYLRLGNSYLILDFRVQLPSGQIKWVSVKGLCQRDHYGMPISMSGTVEDIDKRKHAELELASSKRNLENEVNHRTRELKELIAKLETEVDQRKKVEGDLAHAIFEVKRASEAKSRFVANMSHEIRTPLGVITGYTQLLMGEQSQDGAYKDYVEAIYRNGVLLANLIDDVLDLSKIEAGVLSLDPRWVRISQLSKHLAEMFALRCEQKGLAFSVVDETGGNIHIHIDETRINQILVNLVGNAVKFTDQGKISVRFYWDPKEKHTLLIDIVDTGKGIQSKNHNAIFKEFTQEDDSIHRIYGGTGLGLSLSRKISKVLGGDIQLVNSEVNKGSHFRIVLKSLVTEMGGLDDRKTNGSKYTPPNLTDKHILVVDDVIDNLNLMNIFLKKSYAKVTICSDPKKVSDLVKTHHFDLVLLDIQMPEMDGFQVLTELKKINYKGPIWALTAMSFREELKRITDAGFNHCIRKPIEITTLYDALTNLFFRKGSEYKEPNKEDQSDVEDLQQLEAREKNKPL